jgi:chromatin structure-remodeling complex subunit SFH1
MFLWNLHEALVTPDQFAKTLVDELDFPPEKKPGMVGQISTQIRTQLEEYAGVALHPLFHSTSSTTATGEQSQVIKQDTAGTSTPITTNGTPLPHLNGLTNGTANGTTTPQPTAEPKSTQQSTVSAIAEQSTIDESLNPDDTYRCIVSLNVNIMNKLYSDKFEWSLLHPPGYAEAFAKQTCADLGLAAEWVSAITHAIYEAVLRLKKEACENGGLVGVGDLDNDAAEGVDAGWRYEPEHLADEWEPKVEILSKEEIDRREGDRERQIRRQRRETARFSSTTNMVGGLPQSDYFANPDQSDQPMGRGERSKKKRRFRSLSPSGRETPEQSGYGGGPSLQEM